MRHTVLVYGSEPQRRRVAETIAQHLGADCLGLASDAIDAWEAIVDRLAIDRHLVVCANGGEPAAADAALPIVRSAVHLTGSSLCAVWALGGGDALLEPWMKRMRRSSDRIFAVAPPFPEGIDVVGNGALREAFDLQEKASAATRKSESVTRPPVARRDGEVPPPKLLPSNASRSFPERVKIEGIAPLTAIGIAERGLFEGLRELPKCRAVHAFVLAVLCSDETALGRLLRENAIAALAHAIVGDDVRQAWSIVPREACTTFGAANGAEGVMRLARALLPHPLGEPVSLYVREVADSFESIASLDAVAAEQRTFAPSEALDTAFERWLRACG
jgi:hypothetical protein